MPLHHDLTQEEIDAVRAADAAEVCNTDECQAARRAVRDARAAFYARCTEVDHKAQEARSAREIATALGVALTAAWLAVAASVKAGAIWWITVILLVIAIALSIAAAIATTTAVVFEVQLANLRQGLRAMQGRWQSLVDAWDASCNETCLPIGGLGMPRCTDGTVTVASDSPVAAALKSSKVGEAFPRLPPKHTPA